MSTIDNNLNTIDFPADAAAFLAARLTDAADDQTVRTNLKPMLRGNFRFDFRNRFALKLDQTSALGAVQVIVLRISVIVFVDAAAFQLEFSQ